MTSHLARGQSPRLEMRERSQNILKSSDEISPLVSMYLKDYCNLIRLKSLVGFSLETIH